MELVTKPLFITTSKPARQTLIYGFLMTAATSILLGIAVFAYILFYCKFVPQIEIEKIVHLQYGDGPNPYGIVSLGSELVSRQAYDLFLSLSLPRSPQNLALGNFMTSLVLLRPTHKFEMHHLRKLGVSNMNSPMNSVRADDILFAFRRPAIMTYASLLVSLPSRILTLPLHVFGLLSETETLMIGLGEGVAFARGWKNIPSLALLEIQAGQDIQIYDVSLVFKARFSGLRWLMYNHRVTSFFLFTGLFWISTLVFTTLAWVALSIYSNSKSVSNGRKLNDHLRISGKNMEETTYSDEAGVKKEEITTDDEADIKTEEIATDDEPDLSDTPRTFPTYGRQPPLRFTPRKKYMTDKIEYSHVDSFVNADVDDHDEEDYIKTSRICNPDSGIGTSLSESGRRRRGRGRGEFTRRK